MQRGAVLPIRQSLLDSFPIEDVKKKIKKDRSRAAIEWHVKKGHNVLSDETILSVRRCKEIDGMSRKQILGLHDISENQYKSIIRYATRAHLVPKG